MLKELRIENFAIIDELHLQIHAGLVIFTGETGAGKSILIDAVETLLGGRAEAAMLRSGAERAYVEGVFAMPRTEDAPLHALLEENDLLDDPDQVILAREIRANGRSVARINGRSVSAALLRQAGESLVDVHGQSEHLSLLRVHQHLDLLDAYAGVAAPLHDYRHSYKLLLQLRRELEGLRQAEKDAARRLDTLNYQCNEIEAARLSPDEEETLRAERNRLANAEGLASLAQQALAALDEASPESAAASDLLGQGVHALQGLVRLDPAQNEMLAQAQAYLEGLADVSQALRAYIEAIEFNPRRLDQVEERLGLIQNLKRKYGDSIAAILAYAENARRQMETITHAGERIQELESDEEELLQRLGAQGEELSRQRRVHAEALSRAVEQELLDLQMAGAQFRVDFQQREDAHGVPVEGGRRLAFHADGLEHVEFLIAPNPGEGLKPLVKIASGGETSRLMLALKNVLVSADHVPTLIFDEIDQGIGGRVGAVVGKKLWNLSAQHQVLCVTHLPQLAAFGMQHFHVEKAVQDGRTRTHVAALQGEVRLAELAQMIGGVSQGTLRSAKEILEAAEEQTRANPNPPARPA
ncbi:MAG: DNA repair protein RecN [Chloroflexi bacterium]|nr:DNA repair protein RecN [Chloroflexota bacterium]